MKLVPGGRRSAEARDDRLFRRAKTLRSGREQREQGANAAPPLKKADRVPPEHGASAVELALVAPLVVLITFAIIEFGMMFWGLSRAQSTVASAVRLVGTQSRVDDYEDQISSVMQGVTRSSGMTPIKFVIYRAHPTTGRPQHLAAASNDYSQCTDDCWVFTWNAATRTWTKAASPSWPSTEQYACGSNDQTDFAGVWLEMRYNSATGLGVASRYLRASGIARLEPVPLSSGQDCKPAVP